MKKLLLIYSFLFLTFGVFAQQETKPVHFSNRRTPLIIIDSQRVAAADISKYSPDSVTKVVVIADTSAIKLYGDSAKYGALIVETRSFARRNFISFFRKSSKQYDSLFAAMGNDSTFQYIINGNLQIGNYEGNLSSINDELFEGLEVLTKEQLQTKYKISNKQYGILIHSKIPKDFFNPENKF
jgi:hypothetical protein